MRGDNGPCTFAGQFLLTVVAFMEYLEIICIEVSLLFCILSIHTGLCVALQPEDMRTLILLVFLAIGC